MAKVTEELVKSSTITLDWLIGVMGKAQWERRRKKVVSYFNELSNKIYSPTSDRLTVVQKKFDPIAVYKDWLAWYMYLIESQVQRPTCGDPSQLSRILPIFSAIGRRLDLIKNMEGINNRLVTLVNEKTRDPDATLFELLVAACYARNGWTVKFIDETRLMKTPDFEVTKPGQSYLVECKKLLKVNSYAEQERLAWQKRSFHLFNAMDHFKIPAVAEINFKTVLEAIPETILGHAYFNYIKKGLLETQQVLRLEELDLRQAELILSGFRNT